MMSNSASQIAVVMKFLLPLFFEKWNRAARINCHHSDLPRFTKGSCEPVKQPPSLMSTSNSYLRAGRNLRAGKPGNKAVLWGLSQSKSLKKRA
jgi:hypothetical protein